MGLKIKIECNIFEPIIRIVKKLVYSVKNNYYRVNLKKLTLKEKEIIKKFYNNDLEEYTLNSVSLVENENSYPIILKLIERKILNELNELEKIDNYDGRGVHYTLTNNARKKLNKRKNKLK